MVSSTSSSSMVPRTRKTSSISALMDARQTLLVYKQTLSTLRLLLQSCVRSTLQFARTSSRRVIASQPLQTRDKTVSQSSARSRPSTAENKQLSVIAVASSPSSLASSLMKKQVCLCLSISMVSMQRNKVVALKRPIGLFLRKRMLQHQWLQ